VRHHLRFMAAAQTPAIACARLSSAIKRSGEYAVAEALIRPTAD
jgi:hypothetical protein